MVPGEQFIDRRDTIIAFLNSTIGAVEIRLLKEKVMGSSPVPPTKRGGGAFAPPPGWSPDSQKPSIPKARVSQG
jgi:hypothetical protein